MLSKKEVLRRWQSEPLYLDNGSRRRWMADIIEEYCESSNKGSTTILELGCNAGSNLRELHRRGFSHLWGLDMNEAAVNTMTRSLSCAVGLQGELTVIQNLIPMLKMDIVFSMAVLMHIHPEDRLIFKRLHEITKKYLICAEWTKGSNGYIMPIDPKDFEGFDLIRNEPIEGLEDLVGYSLYVFKKKET